MAKSAAAGGKSTARMKKLNETKMILRQPLLLAAIVLTILLLLLFIGVELNVDSIYWIIWGVAFTIESIDLLGGIHFETDDEEDNEK